MKQLNSFENLKPYNFQCIWKKCLGFEIYVVKYFILICAALIIPNKLFAQIDPTAAPQVNTGLWMDKTDYQPGETAYITGWGFQPNETVTVEVHHADETPNTGEGHDSWTVVADGDGKISTSWYVCEDDCLGSFLRLTAEGQLSGLKLSMYFTDSDEAVTTVVFNSIDQGWYSTYHNLHDSNNKNYIVGQMNNAFRNYFAFNLANLDLAGKQIISAKLLIIDNGCTPGPNTTVTYKLFDVTTNQSDLMASHTSSEAIFHSIFNDLGSGQTYGSFTTTTDVISGRRSFDLNTTALAEIAAHAGSAFSIGGALESAPNNTFLFGCSGTIPQQLIIEVMDVNNITTSTQLASSLCVGNNLSIPFVAEGGYNTANTFTAQLSDAVGSFSSPVTIGTLASTTSGAINATIPANTPAGTGYRVRVVSSDPVVVGADNGSNIAVNSLPTAALSGGGAICSGGTANLSVVLTGTGPWSVTYTDGTTPVTLSNIITSPHTISVSPASTATYSLVSVSDANCDATSLSGTAQVTVNSAPVVTVPTIPSVGNSANSCGASVAFAAPVTGTPTPTISYAINGTPITSPHVFPVGTTTVTATATNSCGTDSETFTVTVTNDAPVLNAITPSTLDPVQINTAFSASATFKDNNLQSTTWDWGDGTTSGGTISGSTISGTRTYAATGVYTAKLTVTDRCGDSDNEIYQYVVVYDPTGGFVTGGGWIDSPAGAYKDDVTLAGKAHFGFVSKYLKGATVPSGNTSFEFQTASLHFKSTSYEWLVVSGATARYKGLGTINGMGNYSFILAATDGQVTGGGGIDKFRIKIWYKNSNNEDVVVYDNNLTSTGDDALAETAIMGGSIVVHEAKKATSSSKAVAAGDLEAEPLKGSFYSYPTAFSAQTTIAFSLEAEEYYVLEVFDMKGALVKKLASGNAEANRLYEFELRSDGMAEGVYITRLTTTSNVRSLKAVLKR